MKISNTLWALAFALMAVSCSDDIEGGGPNGNNGQELDATKAYVKVAINSGTTTKATNGSSTGPEGGEGEGTELGLEDEYKVNDVTIILFQNSNQDGTENFDFKGESEIKGVGFAEVTKQGSSNVPQHQWAATVQVVIDKDKSASLFGKKYGVIAVTNLGKESGLYNKILGTEQVKISNGKDLADYITGYQTANNGFIMSTHAMKWNINDKAIATESVVEIEEGVSENDAPEVNVFVERIAAKVRISEANGVDNFIYELEENSTALAKVRLDEVAIVNQLTSGSYLLKRVTDINPVFSGTIAPNYLADEVWDGTQNQYNYVMDPWIATRDDKATLPQGLTYKNRFVVAEGGNYESMWTGYGKDITSLASATEADFNDNGKIRLAYTMENVTQEAHSLNGYSTGALFKATYFPDKLTIVNGVETEAAFVNYDGNVGANASELDNIDAELAGVDFYEFRNMLYDSQEAIFVDIINHSVNDKDLENYNYSKFQGKEFNDMKISDYKTYFSHISEPFGYIDELNRIIEKYTTENPSEEIASKTMADLTSAKNFNDFMTDKVGQSIGDVRFYEGGVCYYPYWIRHANNNKASVMGIMEFAIVRNNIYDLTVTGMNSLGYSGSEVPDPTDPDEDGKARINVNLFVKNWVVRNNGDIIL